LRHMKQGYFCDQPGAMRPGSPEIPEYLIFRLHSTLFGYCLL
jgi:hypothetical protein